MRKMRQKIERKNLGAKILLILVISVVFGLVFDFVCTRIEYITHPKPDKYVEYVKNYSERFSVPEEIIWAVIKTESGFDPYATSDVGAVGLMQLMPSTFTEITEDRLKEGLDPIKRLDPDTNIKYGTYYLSYLFARYGDWDAVFAAYNGGLGNVDEWMGEDEKLTLDEISFKETRNYVKKVNNAIEKYKKLYAFDK